MKFVVATLLVIISMGNAEPARFGESSRQENAPYKPSGWRPQGAPFTLPEGQRALPQQTYNSPPTSYVPSEKYGPPQSQRSNLPTNANSNNAEKTDEEPQVENFKVSSSNNQPSKLQQEQTEQQPGAYYLVLPQSQNFVYAVQQSAPIVALQQSNIIAKIQTLPVSNPLNTLYNPYTASVVQIY